MSEHAGEGVRLLWIDDQISEFGSHIEDLLEHGYAVTAVATTEEALSTLGSEPRFEAILVDLKIPDGDGIELLLQLSAAVKKLGTRIIVLSSFLYDPTIRRRLVLLKMDIALLEKDADPSEHAAASLAERVDEALQREGLYPRE